MLHHAWSNNGKRISLLHLSLTQLKVLQGSCYTVLWALTLDPWTTFTVFVVGRGGSNKTDLKATRWLENRLLSWQQNCYKTECWKEKELRRDVFLIGTKHRGINRKQSTQANLQAALFPWSPSKTRQCNILVTLVQYMVAECFGLPLKTDFRLCGWFILPSVVLLFGSRSLSNTHQSHPLKGGEGESTPGLLLFR